MFRSVSHAGVQNASRGRVRTHAAATFGLSLVHALMYYEGMTTSTAVRLDAIRRVGKALADPTRAAILLALLDGSRYPAELVDELGVTKQTVSNHLACLRDCGIVVAEPSGRRVLYEISDARLRHALQDLVGVVLAVDPVDACDVNENDPETRA